MLYSSCGAAVNISPESRYVLYLYGKSEKQTYPCVKFRHKVVLKKTKTHTLARTMFLGHNTESETASFHYLLKRHSAQQNYVRLTVSINLKNLFNKYAAVRLHFVYRGRLLPAGLGEHVNECSQSLVKVLQKNFTCPL